MSTTSDVCKLLILDFLKTEVSAKFSAKCRTKLGLNDNAKLPSDYPTLAELVENFVAASKAGKKKLKNGKKSDNKKRKLEISGSDEDLEVDDEDEDQSPPKKAMKNGSVTSKDSSYESESENVSSGNGQSCFNCKKTGHFSRECPEKSAPKCFNCNQTGHMSRDCPDKQSSGSVCFNCNKTGHFSRECPDKQTRSGSCYNCNETGHMSRDCPKRSGGGRNRPGTGSGPRKSFGYGYSGTGSNSVPLGARKSTGGSD